MTDAPERCSLSRRQFVQAGSLATSLVLLGDLFAGRVRAQDAEREVAFTRFDRQRIGKLSELKAGQPVVFHYPRETPHTAALLVKLGEPAGGGIGPDDDVVAFNSVCTHMGGHLDGTFHAKQNVCGPCPVHLTTFDLTRHGMVVAGHATAPLPQIVLEAEGDDVFAVGIAGLIYGYADNADIVAD